MNARTRYQDIDVVLSRDQCAVRCVSLLRAIENLRNSQILSIITTQPTAFVLAIHVAKSSMHINCSAIKSQRKEFVVFWMSTQRKGFSLQR
jgi:TusA-related sulfurtransferase